MIIRTFEGFDTELYKRITSFEFINTISNLNFIDFSKGKIIQLNKLFEGTDWKVSIGRYSNNIKTLSTYCGSKTESEGDEYYDAFTSTEFVIHELEDEYFVLRLEVYSYSKYPYDDDYVLVATETYEDKPKCWRCDGIDGLIECIEENILSL